MLLSLSFAACTSSTPSGATCPDSNAPTYGSFGSAFFGKYCTDCHSATSANRHAAPTDINLDTLADIAMHAADIDLAAAFGPKANNADMPETDADVPAGPTDAERVLLGQFLACVEQGKN